MFRIARLRPQRFLSIKTLTTPNENALKFVADSPILPPSSSSFEMKRNNTELISHSPLANKIFTEVPGVESLMLGPDFVTINKEEFKHWNELTAEIKAILADHLVSGEPAITDKFEEVHKSAEIGYDDDLPKIELDAEEQEISDEINELIQTKIRPAIQDDGGDIVYRGWDPKTGIVYLKLQGACKSCSSSEDTLKGGIESMLKHYVDEVEKVVQILDPEEKVALAEFEKLEKKLQNKE